MNRGRKKKRVGLKIIIVIIILLFIATNIFKWTPFHSFGLKITEPVLKIKDMTLSPFNNFFSYFKSKRDLETKNEELEKEIANLKIEVLSSQILEFEHKDLLEQVIVNSDNDLVESVEIAKVISRPPFSSFDSLLLSGNFDDTKIGQKVFYRNILLGEIVDVTPTVATVKLNSASGNTFIGRLGDGSEFEILGRGSGQYEMTLQKGVDIKQGDPIIYPEEKIVLIGIVNQVFATDDDLFNKVLFNIPINFKDLNYVRIGQPMDVLE